MSKLIPSREELEDFIILLERYSSACRECKRWREAEAEHREGNPFLPEAILWKEIRERRSSTDFLVPFGWSDGVIRALRPARFKRLSHLAFDAKLDGLAELIKDLDAAMSAGIADERPKWDPDGRQLWYGATLCRDFRKRRAPAQIRIVEAFDEAKWKKPIRAPFSEKTLRDNIRHLNGGLEAGSPIEFEPSGPVQMAWKLR